MTNWTERAATLQTLHRKGLVSDVELEQAMMQVNKGRKQQNTTMRRQSLRSNDYLYFQRKISRDDWLANNREIERRYQ